MKKEIYAEIKEKQNSLLTISIFFVVMMKAISNYSSGNGDFVEIAFGSFVGLNIINLSLIYLARKQLTKNKFGLKLVNNVLTVNMISLGILILRLAYSFTEFKVVDGISTALSMAHLFMALTVFAVLFILLLKPLFKSK